MPESQIVEYKTSWRDEFLKWICGFANANGGTIFIGKNDDGQIVGLQDSKRLLEDIPNKVKDVLGILVDVNLHEENDLEYIEIVVEAYPYPVNYKGQYHYRSGSVKMELKGSVLDKFLLEKKGKRWDAVPIPNVKVTDLKSDTFDSFRKKALRSQRIEEDVLTDSNEILIENLHLNENGYLKRAAILLFHPNPEKFVVGAYIKIGFFETDEDLRYQDEIHGNLFEQVEKAMDLLFSKYIKAEISYESITRVEKYEYPKEAIREALLNAIAHKDYANGVPIQISVYHEKIIFWNEGSLPENWTIENLLEKHPSKPYNPDIANAFFRSGYIESWGRGTLKIVKECLLAGLPKPAYFYDMSGFFVIFERKITLETDLKQSDLNLRQKSAIIYIRKNGKITNMEYQKLFQIGRTSAFRDLNDLVIRGLIKTSKSRGPNTFYEL